MSWVFEEESPRSHEWDSKIVHGGSTTPFMYQFKELDWLTLEGWINYIDILSGKTIGDHSKPEDLARSMESNWQRHCEEQNEIGWDSNLWTDLSFTDSRKVDWVSWSSTPSWGLGWKYFSSRKQRQHQRDYEENIFQLFQNFVKGSEICDFGHSRRKIAPVVKFGCQARQPDECQQCSKQQFLEGLSQLIFV